MKSILILLLTLASGAANDLIPVDPNYSDLNSDTEGRCLSAAMYFEAASESQHGWRATAEVILNRRDLSGKWVCDVIAAPAQFSWFKQWPTHVNDKTELWDHIYITAQDELTKRRPNKPPFDQVIPNTYLYFCSGDCVRHCKGTIIDAQCYY